MRPVFHAIFPVLLLLFFAGCGGGKAAAKKSKPAPPKGKAIAAKTTPRSKPEAPEPVKTLPASSVPAPESKSSTTEASTPDKSGSPSIPSASSADKFDPSQALSVAELLQKLADPKTGVEFINEPVKVRGVVTKFYRNFQETRWSLTLADHRNASQTQNLWLVDNQPWLKAVPGQVVVLQGKLNAIRDIDDASILAVGENPLPVVSAEQLTAESAADRKGANRKYAHKWILCTGIVPKPVENNMAELEVKGDLKLQFINFSKPDLLKDLPVGKPAVLLAQCEFRPEGEPVVLREALLRPAESVKQAANGLALYIPPAEETGPPVAKPRPATPPSKATFSVAELQQDFEQEAFVEKYSQQWVTVQGFVRSGHDGRENDKVTLQVDPHSKEPEGVQCRFVNAHDAQRLMPSQRVTLKGQLPNLLAMLLSKPVLLDCELIEAGENPVKSLSPDELAAQAKAEEEAERSDNEWLVCAGTFAGYDNRGNALVRGSKGATVVCTTLADELFEAYFEDDPIRVLGYRDRKGRPAKAALENCFPIK